MESGPPEINRQADLLFSESSDEKIDKPIFSGGQCIKKLSGHTTTVVSVLLYDENHIVSGSFDNTIKIWNIDSGKEVRTFRKINDHHKIFHNMAITH